MLFSSGRSRRSCGGGGDGLGKCLICFEEVKSKIKVPKEFGTRPIDAFLKICEVLKVSFLEIQNDWKFGEQAASSEALPFCSECFAGFHTILKLQTQLAELQRKIDEKTDEIIGKIQSSNAKGIVGDLKVTAFREKALRQVSNNFRVNSINPTGNNISNSTVFSNSTTPSTAWSSQQSLPTTTSSRFSGSSQDYQHFTISTQNHSIQISTNNTSLYSTSPKVEASSTNPSQEFSQTYFHGNDEAAPASFDGDDGGNNFSEFSNPDSTDEEDNHKDNNLMNKPTRRKRAIHTYAKRERDDLALAALFPPVPAHNKKSQKKDRQPEYFSPVTTDPKGRKLFEGILLTPTKSGYKCGQCDAILGKKADTLSLRKAKIHIKGVHLGLYKCSLCEKNFSSHDILSQHLFRIHDTGESPCPTCAKPIRERNMRQHLFTHMNASEQEAAIAAGFKKHCFKGELTIPCRICGKLFPTQSKRRRHELTHVSSKFRRDYKCPHCDKAYTTEQGRKEHIYSVHESLNARRTLCKICGESVVARNLGKHLANHGEMTCKHCEKTFVSELNYRRHEEKCGKPQKKKEGYEWECDICNKYFPSKRYMQLHRKNVHKSHWKLKVPLNLWNDVSVENPREEPLDDLNNEGIQHVEGHVYSYQLYNLEKLEEGEGQRYRCCSCQEEIWGEENVKEHVRSVHIGNFRCNWCTKRMKSWYEAEAHRRKEHSKMQTFDCEICGRTAMSRNMIKKHVWEHKNVWEVAEAINAGEGIPTNFQMEEMYDVLRSLGVEVDLKCGICEKGGFRKVEELYQHRCEEHPEVPQLRVNRLKVYKKRGPKGKRKRKVEEKVERRSSGRKVKVVAEEDSEEEEMDYGQVEIKEEVVSPNCSEEGEEQTGSSEEEEEHQKRKRESGGSGSLEREEKKWRSQPFRTSLRRRTSRTANYAEDESDEDLNIKRDVEEWTAD